MSRSLGDLIAATNELRSLPVTALKLMRLLDDATVGADEVLDVIEKDPSLTANLLKLCNSAYYGLRRQVGTVRAALVMLGNQAIVSLAFATSMGDVLRGPLGAYRLGRDELWHHALATAVGAAHLVGAGDPAQGLRERAFTGGLVHDIGKLLLNAPLREKLQQLPPDSDLEDMRLSERMILGFDHAQAGAALGVAWNFPADLVRVIAHHHDPENLPDTSDDECTLLRAVAAANLAAGQLGYGGGSAALETELFVDRLERLGVDPASVEQMMVRVPGDLTGLIGPLRSGT